MQQPNQDPETQQEESIFNEADWSTQGYDKHIRNARIMLYIVAGLQLLPLLTLGPIAEDVYWIVIGLQLFFVAVFVALAIWTKYKPFAALMTAMIFFICIWLLGAILNPATIFSGILVKVIVVILLILGIRNARDAEEVKKTFNR
jgi:hypothetical protein